MRSLPEKSFRRLPGLALLALLPHAAHAQQAVFIVRHAEKELPTSNAPEVPLSEAGMARAARLAALLRDAGVTAIFATDTIRARSTAAPLADAVKRPIQTYSEVPTLAESLRRNPQAIALVVGHSNTVPALLAALGVPEKIQLGDGDYDNLFVVVAGAAESPILLRLRY